MSAYSKPYNAGSTSIRRRCASGGRRRASVRHRQSPHGCHALSDEDTAASCLRDGATRTRLQSHPRHENHGHRAAYGRDQGIANTSPTPALYASWPGVSTRPRPNPDMRANKSYDRTKSSLRARQGGQAVVIRKGLPLIAGGQVSAMMIAGEEACLFSAPTEVLEAQRVIYAWQPRRSRAPRTSSIHNRRFATATCLCCSATLPMPPRTERPPQ